MSDIALVIRTVDYRGDHAADMAVVKRVPLSTTVSELLAICKVHSRYCQAVVEVKPEVDGE